MIRHVAGVLLLALAFALTACGDEGKLTDKAEAPGVTPTVVASVTSSTPQPFTIVESAYFTEPAIGNPGSVYLHWAAVLKNPNPITYGLFPTVTVTARDEAGAVVGTQDQVLGELPPDGRIAFAGQITATTTPKTVDFTPGKVEWRETKTRIADYPPFTAKKVTMRPDTIYGYVVAGDVVSPYAKPVKQLAVTALLRDAGGKLLGGRTAYIDGPAAKGSRPFSINTGKIPGPVAGVEIRAMPWGGAAEWNQLTEPQ